MVTLTATDAAGLTDTCTATVTVVDTTPPAITACAPSRTVAADANCEGALPDLIGQITATDNCGTVNVTQSPAAGTMFAGTQVVTLTATDDTGLKGTCATLVTVQDTTPPELTCPPAVEGQCAPPAAYASLGEFVQAGGAVTDNCGVDEASFALDGETSDNQTCPETIVRTYLVEDLSGNEARRTQTVTVEDTQAPEFDCPSDTTIVVVLDDRDGTGVLPDLSEDLVIVDNCTEPASVVLTQEPPAGSQVAPGELPVAITAGDLCGNQKRCEFDVTVRGRRSLLIAVFKGWNLLSLPEEIVTEPEARPRDGADAARSSLPMPAYFSPWVYPWNSASQAYEAQDTLPAGTAFWAYSGIDTVLGPILYLESETDPGLRDAWNLVGVSMPQQAADLAAEGRAGVLPFWTWDPIEKRYVLVLDDDLLEPGAGCWMFRLPASGGRGE